MVANGGHPDKHTSHLSWPSSSRKTGHQSAIQDGSIGLLQHSLPTRGLIVGDVLSTLASRPTSQVRPDAVPRGKNFVRIRLSKISNGLKAI